jgi:hypothetical protein
VGGKSTGIAVLVLVACSQHASGNGADGTTWCPDDAGGPLAPKREGGRPAFPAPDASAVPDPSNWFCYTDSDCSAFPDFPYCDQFFCAGPQRAVTCTSGTKSSGLPNPGVSHTFSGNNGTFADSCDANGNLLGYQCERTTVPCTKPPNCPPDLIYTGNVVPSSQLVDCSGTCRAAHCDGRCPEQGDQLTFDGLDTDGREIVHNDSDGRTYACRTAPPTAGGFDCTKIAAGQTGYVLGRGITATFCTSAAEFGSIGVVLDGVPTPRGSETCGFACGIRFANCGPR